MATFTIPLKRAIELSGGDPVNVGLGVYPIFDEAYRTPLNAKIVDRYWNREIGMESLSMFRLAMRRKMNEIMPLYNKLYLSEQITFDPLSTVNLHTIATADGTETSANTTVSNNDSKSRSVNSTTPQTMLSGNADYATSAADASSNATSDATANATNTNDQKTDSTVSGYQGPAAELLMRYRASLLNIDLMILDELNELFMTVWDNGNEYAQGNTWGIF